MGCLASNSATAALLSGCIAALTLAAPAARAETTTPASQPRQGTEELTSVISEVDACNRAQQQRPAGAVVTDMHYWRVGQPGARAITCRVRWSTATDAQPTRRPILFGPSL